MIIKFKNNTFLEINKDLDKYKKFFLEEDMNKNTDFILIDDNNNRSFLINRREILYIDYEKKNENKEVLLS